MDVVGSKTLEIMGAASWYHKWMIARVKKYINGDILEVGAGLGNVTKLLVKYGNVTAIDFDKRYLSKLKKKKYNAGFGDIEKGQYFFSTKSGHRGKKFDTIVSTNVLEHIGNDKRALKNMFRLLKKEGRLILLVPAHQWAYGKIDRELGHLRRYNKQGLTKMFLEVGFKIEAARYLNWFSLPGWILNGRI